MMQSLTPEGFFYIYLPKGGIFSELTLKIGVLNTYVRGGFSDITVLEANPGQVCNFHMCDVETRSLQCTYRMVLFSQIGPNLIFAYSQTAFFNIKYIFRNI